MFADFPFAGAPFASLGVQSISVSVELTGVSAQGLVNSVSEVTGNPNVLSYTLDTSTLPNDTVTMINGVVDPTKGYPGNGNIPTPVAGQRYLLTDSVIQNGYWGTVSADANDIIEYNGSNWEVVFDSTSSPNNMQYVTNLTTELQYRWTGSAWVKSYQGLYPGGTWSLVL